MDTAEVRSEAPPVVKRRWPRVVVAVVTVALIIGGILTTWSLGQRRGYSAGRQEGYATGHTAGYKEGVGVQHQRANEDYIRGYQNALFDSGVGLVDDKLWTPGQAYIVRAKEVQTNPEMSVAARAGMGERRVIYLELRAELRTGVDYSWDGSSVWCRGRC